jgi:hypothetical protein
MRMLTSAIVFTAAIATAASASAQGTGTSSSTQRPPSTAKPATAKPPQPKPKIGYRAFFVLDVESMTASQSFKAVTGSSTLIGYGGGGEVLNLWKHLFARGAVAFAPASGERVFVIDGDVISTGVPIDVGVRTVEIGAGWRLPLRKHPKYTPYFGGGVLFTNHSESSQFGTDADNVHESTTGGSVQGGLDLTLSKRIYAVFEAQYRVVPNAFGAGGIADVYDETDLGGFVFRVMVGFRLGK